jgi:hypothetical protein
MSVPKRFCLRGHDIDVVGRDASHNCRQCRREWDSNERRREKHRQMQKERRRIARKEGRLFIEDVSQAAYDMRRHDLRLPATRVRRGLTKQYAALAWSSRWHCTDGAGGKAADRLWAADRITIDCADRWCVALGMSLAAVYPEVYYEPRRTADIPLIPDDETVDV